MTQGAVLLKLVVHLVLTGLPLLAVMLVSVRAGLRRVPVILCAGVAGSGAAAMLVFWVFFASPAVGRVLVDVLLVVSGGAIVWSMRGGVVGRDLLAQLLTPLGLWALGTGFLVFLGFLHGGVTTPVAMSANRFSYQLPSDNIIPGFFAQWFYVHGHHGTPPMFPGGWQVSDRPPLQIGYVLSQEGLDWDKTGLGYQVLGVMLQQLWIVGLWALLLAARLGRITRALAVLTVLVSDLAIVNGFFVWPKLLPAAMR